MFLTDTNYPCPLSIVAFGSIVESLNSEVNPCFLYSESNIAFVDGDSADIPSMVKSIYDLRKENKVVYTITFLSKGNECSTVIRHLSDLVVDKQIRYAALENLVRMMVASEPKALADNVFGDIWGGILTSFQKEHRVLKLLLEGYSQYQIAKMLHLSIKTVSGYKIKAVKRYGARNFNELYMLKFSNNF